MDEFANRLHKIESKVQGLEVRIEGRLARIEEKLDVLSHGQSRCAEHNARLNNLEKSVANGQRLMYAIITLVLSLIIKSVLGH